MVGPPFAKKTAKDGPPQDLWLWQPRPEVVGGKVIARAGLANLLRVVVRHLNHSEVDLEGLDEILPDEASRINFPSHPAVLVLHQFAQGPNQWHDETVRKIVLTLTPVKLRVRRVRQILWVARLRLGRIPDADAATLPNPGEASL